MKDLRVQNVLSKYIYITSLQKYKQDSNLIPPGRPGFGHVQQGLQH
jgi:hypothetical protein